MTDSTVTAVQAKWLEKLPPMRLARAWATLTVAMAVCFAIVGGVMYGWRGEAALQAAAVAAGVCWLGSSLALAGTAMFGRTGVNGPMYTLLFGMAFNCGLPFVTGLALNRLGGPLAEAGVFGLIVVFFQFALVVETLLSLCLIKPER